MRSKSSNSPTDNNVGQLLKTDVVGLSLKTIYNKLNAFLNNNNNNSFLRAILCPGHRKLSYH